MFFHWNKQHIWGESATCCQHLNAVPGRGVLMDGFKAWSVNYWTKLSGGWNVKRARGCRKQDCWRLAAVWEIHKEKSQNKILQGESDFNFSISSHLVFFFLSLISVLTILWGRERAGIINPILQRFLECKWLTPNHSALYWQGQGWKLVFWTFSQKKGEKLRSSTCYLKQECPPQHPWDSGKSGDAGFITSQELHFIFKLLFSLSVFKRQI